MSSSYPGNSGSVTGRVNPSITIPSDADAGNAASVNGAFQALCDQSAFMQAKVVLMGGTNSTPFTLTATSGTDAITATGNAAGAGANFTGGSGGGNGVTAAGAGAGSGVAATGGGTNGIGVKGTGVGTGQGGQFTGGTTGRGVTGQGGATSGEGVYGLAGASGYSGVYGVGGGSNTAAVAGVASGTGNGYGVQGIGLAAGAGGVFTGGATGAGVTGQGGATSGIGGSFTGGPGSAGVTGTGGSTSGVGGQFTASAGNSAGATGAGNGSGAGLSGTGGATGAGLTGTGGGTSGVGGIFAPSNTTTPASSNINMPPLSADPSTLNNGDVWATSTDIKARLGGASFVLGKTLRGTLVWNPGSISAGANLSNTITVTGAVAGSDVFVTGPAMTTGLVLTAYVSGANTVTINISNPSSGALVAISGTFAARVFG